MLIIVVRKMNIIQALVYIKQLSLDHLITKVFALSCYMHVTVQGFVHAQQEHVQPSLRCANLC